MTTSKVYALDEICSRLGGNKKFVDYGLWTDNLKGDVTWET
jgi:hypothetical protein